MQQLGQLTFRYRIVRHRKPATKPRWCTKAEVLARIRELERLEPLRTVPTTYTLNYKPAPHTPEKAIKSRGKLLPRQKLLPLWPRTGGKVSYGP